MLHKGNVYEFVRGVTPPILFSAMKNSRAYPHLKSLADRTLRRDSSIPQWNVIQSGLLKGRKIFVPPNGGWDHMISGNYDDFFIRYLKSLDLEGKVIYDVGAHFGFSSLCFAELVGANGHVVAFEPNVFNKDRFELIMSKNSDLAALVELRDVALSDKSGEEDFVFSDNVDGGSSSGSFIDSADTFFEKSSYEADLGFKRVKVRTVPVDGLADEGVTVKPDLIKIDVEGAEHLVIEGARKTLEECRPILLMEIHSIFNMLTCGETLRDLGYEIELLKEESDGRCFIAAVFPQATNG